MCDAYIEENADENRKLHKIVEKGINETLKLFEKHPEMFSTEGDCVAHLYRIIGNEKYKGIRLFDPHPKTGACALRREWKRRGSDDEIDLMVIDAETFNVKKDAGSKKEGGFGSADTHVVIEVKGPQLQKDLIEKDIEDVSELLGQSSKPRLANKGYVVVFGGKDIDQDWDKLKHMAKDRGVCFYYKITKRFI